MLLFPHSDRDKPLHLGAGDRLASDQLSWCTRTLWGHYISLFSVKKEYKILLQGTVCTNILEIRTTLVCSLSLSYLWFLTKQILIPPPTQPNSLMWKLYLRHCRPLKYSSLTGLMSPGMETEWVFLIDLNTKPQRLNDLPKGRQKQLLLGQSSIVTISQEIHTSAYVVLGALPVEKSSQFPNLGGQCHRCSNKHFSQWDSLANAWLHLRQFYKMAKIASFPTHHASLDMPGVHPSFLSSA